MLVIVCGLIASGKTTVAKYITTKVKGVLLRTDIFRKKMYPHPTYNEDENQQIYNIMFEEAKKLLKSKSVILDATFYQEKNRKIAKQIANNLNVDFKIVEIIFSNDNLAKKRIETRSGDESDTNYKEYLKVKLRFEPIKEDHIIINNSESLKKTYAQIDYYF